MSFIQENKLYMRFKVNKHSYFREKDMDKGFGRDLIEIVDVDNMFIFKAETVKNIRPFEYYFVYKSDYLLLFGEIFHS